MSEKIIKMGTRGSDLALYQTRLAAKKIKEQIPDCVVEEVVIRTTGDQSALISNAPDPFDTKRVFTREIEKALMEGRIDLAVHSAKDVATTLPEGLCIAAYLERDDARDAFISASGKKFLELEEGACVGTSSLRRTQQLKLLRSDLKVEPIRGNVGTRIGKMESGQYDAIVLAQAGLNRLDLENVVTETFASDVLLPAPGQGAILLQIREQDKDLKDQLGRINHELTEQQLLCERAFLKALEGGCQLPCGIHTEIKDKKMMAYGGLFAIEEREKVIQQLDGEVINPEKLGIDLARKILSSGGQEILDAIPTAP